MAEIYENMMEAVSPGLNDCVRIVTSGNNSRRTLLSALARLIVEEYDGTTLAGQARAVKDAINALNTAAGNEATARQNADTALGNRITAVQTAIYIGADGLCYSNLEEG